jgi:hypothetical protein
MSLADDVLQRLLARGERARLRASDRAIRESFTSPDSLFWKQSLDERDAFHLRMRQAAASGAVALQWAKQGGDDRPLASVRLLDLDRLATYLGATTRADQAQLAARRLEHWCARYPRVGEILERWRVLKPAHGLTPDDAGDLEEALRVMDELERMGRKDQVLRAFSASFFHDSKRIESLARHLDALTCDSLGAPARPAREVFSTLGLVKAAMPFLIAGQGMLKLAAGQQCPVVTPYLGVAPDAVEGFAGTPGWVMAVENLTTFHQAADLVAQRGGGLVVYTGGMPSPSWCRAYAALLASLASDIPTYHWGDVDEGGFRIAAHIRVHCVGPQRLYQPWLMSIDARTRGARQIPLGSLQAMQRSARRAGWLDLVDHLQAFAIEQEALPVDLPGRPALGAN